MEYPGFLFVVGLLGCFCAHQGCGTSEWVQINSDPVCFSGSYNHPGTFHSESSGSFAAAVKLVHRSGSIRCVSIQNTTAILDVTTFKGLEKHPLNVLVTNAANTIKFPTNEVNILQPNQAYWYGLDGVNSRSNEIVLQHSFANPYFIYRNQMLRVWYGEDYTNKVEAGEFFF